ncbi:MAG: hypothetical protein JTT11_03800 [Candidatus Brockarchaeota archaeon]|nr:hypothetical protein [Candidatus Brockarchaeota archaeon]
MSGFGGIFAAAMIGIIFTMSFNAVMQLYINDLLACRVERPGASAQSTPKVGSGILNGTHVFLVNVTMDGAKSIKFEDLNLSDVFVIHYSGGTKVTEKVVMGNGSGRWRVNRVLVGNREGELVNPINEASQTGMWDPGETLELLITTSSPIDDDLWFFSIALVDGGACSRTFG